MTVNERRSRAIFDLLFSSPQWNFSGSLPMALDPKFGAMLAMPGAQLERPPADVTPAMMREGVRLRASPLPPVPVDEVKNIRIAGPAGAINVRLYYPISVRPLPLTVFMHGGGWVLCDLGSHDNLCRSLALASNSVVAAVEYRLAPETKFPGPLEDCYAALTLLVARAASLGIDASRIAVSGDSSGGNLAAALALLSRKRKGPSICFQALMFPVMDASCSTASYVEFGQGYMISREIMQWFWECYLLNPSDAQNPLAAPLRESTLVGLPSASISTCEFDVLRDEGEAYADALREAGVSVISRRYLGMIHGFMTLPYVTEVADRAIADIGGDLAGALYRPR